MGYIPDFETELSIVNYHYALNKNSCIRGKKLILNS